MSRAKTRELLLDAGKKVFLERGFGNSGLELILQSSGVPKGSFYYYFESKEDFGLKVLERFAECYEQRLDEALSDDSVSPLERLRNFFEKAIASFDADHCGAACLVGKLSVEMADLNETFRLKLEEIFDRRVDRYAECLQQARDLGQIGDEVSPRRLAEFWLQGWQGAMLRAKSSRHSGPLKLFLDVMFRQILPVSTRQGVDEELSTYRPV